MADERFLYLAVVRLHPRQIVHQFNFVVRKQIRIMILHEAVDLSKEEANFLFGVRIGSVLDHMP